MSKLKRHHKIEITAICLLLALSVAFVSFLSVHQFSSHELRVKYFFMEDENAIDVVNIGASEIYTGFSPEYIWHNYGRGWDPVGMLSWRPTGVYPNF